MAPAEAAPAACDDDHPVVEPQWLAGGWHSAIVIVELSSRI
jgi:hypothetical protein